MAKLILETTAPFQGPPGLVAYDGGLFPKEGLTIEWADRKKGVKKTTDVDATNPTGFDPFSSHGRLLEQGRADMYNACEWGNYCRVQETTMGSRPIGRRGIVTFAATAMRGDFEIAGFDDAIKSAGRACRFVAAASPRIGKISAATPAYLNLAHPPPWRRMIGTVSHLIMN